MSDKIVRIEPKRSKDSKNRDKVLNIVQTKTFRVVRVKTKSSTIYYELFRGKESLDTFDTLHEALLTLDLLIDLQKVTK